MQPYNDHRPQKENHYFIQSSTKHIIMCYNVYGMTSHSPEKRIALSDRDAQESGQENMHRRSGKIAGIPTSEFRDLKSQPGMSPLPEERVRNSVR
ncbi:hypothetical protein CEXT_381451 [Caerostris extrusa]|uniref:Uncharacterized protein n=1 Tax=Caerostris extrusa TaxID=172846 RepID=A0AAV4XMF9_CAEEX|nr:hypothetical protein CEXT_381451 [Caerostris extrusa]